MKPLVVPRILSLQVSAETSEVSMLRVEDKQVPSIADRRSGEVLVNYGDQDPGAADCSLFLVKSIQFLGYLILTPAQIEL